MSDMKAPKTRQLTVFLIKQGFVSNALSSFKR